MTTINFIFSFLTFISTKIFSILLDGIGVDDCLFIHGIGWIVGAIYVLFVLKETTGQSLDEIGLEEAAK